MTDELHLGYRIIPETNTGFYASLGSPQTAPQTLSSFVGYAAANLNMMPWGVDWQYTDFTNSQFLTTNASISSPVAGPTGSTTAIHLTENNANGGHDVFGQNVPSTKTISPIVFRLSAIAKAAERTRIVLMYTASLDEPVTGNTVASVGFDLNGGNTFDPQAGTNLTIVTSGMNSLGNGWWLCYFDFYDNRTPQALVEGKYNRIYLDNGSGTLARSISYAGDGTSGVNLWWFNLLPKAAWTMTKQVRFDDFNDLSTIDVNNTRNPGYNWYVNNLFPSSYMFNFGWATRPPSFATSSTYLSISSPSVLKLYNPNNNQNNYTSQLWSVADDGAGGLVGESFNGPLLIEWLANWNTATNFFPDIPGGCALWGVSQASLLAAVPPSTRFVEWDIVESEDTGNQNSTIHVHEWGPSPDHLEGSTGNELSFPMVDGVFRRNSGLWLTSTMDGMATWGMLMFFFDGQYVQGELVYNASSTPFPPLDANAVVGSIFEMESTPFVPIMSTSENNSANPGGGFPVYVDWVKIHTTP